MRDTKVTYQWVDDYGLIVDELMAMVEDQWVENYGLIGDELMTTD